jgi:hypothetical protein
MVAATYPLFSIRCGNHWYRNRGRARASGQRERALGGGIPAVAESQDALVAGRGSGTCATSWDGDVPVARSPG